MSNIPSGATLAKTSEVMQRLKRGKTWLHKRIKSDPTFPRPVYLSPREPQFFQHEIDAWLIKQAEKRPQVVQEVNHDPA